MAILKDLFSRISLLRCLVHLSQNSKPLKRTFHSAAWQLAQQLLLLACLVPACSLWAQIADTSVFNVPAVPVPGVGHNYISNLNETVNPADGTVAVSIQVPAPSGRGLTLPFSIAYSSSNSSHMVPSGTSEPVGSALQYYFSQNNGFLSVGGWSYTLPTLSFAVGQKYADQSQSDTGTVPAYCNYFSNYVFREPAGQEDSLYLSLVAAQPYPSVPGFSCENGLGLQQSLYANNGHASATLAPGSIVPQPTTNGTFYPALVATVSDLDGTIYDFSSYSPHPTGGLTAWTALPTLIEDRNGNEITVTDGDSTTNCNASGVCSGTITVTDTLGRTALSLDGFGATGNTVSVGGLSKPYTITWNSSNVADYSINLSTEQFLESQGCPGSGTTSYRGPGPGISSISLPNGQQYKFLYDGTYGYLSEIEYPSGGYVSYSYALNSLSTVDGFTSHQTGIATNCGYRYDQAAISQRNVSFDGKTVALAQTFQYATKWSDDTTITAWTNKTTTVTTKDNFSGANYSTVYTYEPVYANVPPNDSTPSVTRYYPGLETQIQYYKDTNTTGVPLLTVTKGWYGPNYLACEIDAWSTGQISGTFYTWQAEGVLADKKEYDFGLLTSASVCKDNATAPSGITPTRETAVNFQKLGPSPLFYQPGSPNFSLPTIIDRPCSVITNGAGSKIGETDYLYDGGTATCGTAGTPSVTAATTPKGTHDESNFSATSASSRGNVTQLTLQCPSGCASNPETTLTYDETGQVLSKTDPCGNSTCGDMTGATHTTTYAYTDRPSGGNAAGNSNAFLTQITDPLGHSEQFSYNYPTSELASSTDVGNGLTTTYWYLTNGRSGSTEDPFNRLTETDFPDGGKTNISYNDSIPSVTTTKLQTPNPTTTSVAIMDGMGHVIQTQTSETNGADVVSTSYAGVGQVYTVTNPFLSSSQPSSSLVPTPSGTPLTTHYYDAMARPVKTVEQDGNTLQWCYNGVASTPAAYCNTSPLGTATGTWVDSTDENGNHWQRTSDSFGRLLDVMEPNGASAGSAMETDYTYNALNDLLSVTQKGTSGSTARVRSFTYDSLSRLVQAFNPEVGWICYGTTPSNAAPTVSNCTEGYDANGNLAAKTDGRGAVVSYTYDALNRKTSEVSTTLPTFTHSFYYDQTSVAGIAFSNPIGRLTTVSTWYNGSPTLVAETTLYWKHDAMGRPLGTKTCIETTCNNTNIADSTWYNLNNTYDLAGNLSSYTDGFGTTVSATYDIAGRLSTVSTTGNGTTPTGTLWTANSYSPVGLTKATFGSNLAVESLQYTNRMALQSSSTVNASGTTLYSEGMTYYPNLNVNTAADSVNGNWTYTYDTLNRLSTAVASNAGEGCQFGYDPFGNRKSEAAYQGTCFTPTPFTFTGTATNRVDGYCYDAAGNLLDPFACPGTGVKHQYYYDGFGNLLSPNYNSATPDSYTVDALGQRIAKWSGSGMTNQYLYDADGQAVAEMDGSGNWVRTNVRMGGQLLAELQGTKTFYRLNDHLGTLRAEFGSDGCLSTYTSLPFGDGQTTATSGCADATLHHFTGKERDTESGNDYFGARYYASSMGRFMSPDAPVDQHPADPQSWNLYSYVRNNPLVLADPTGDYACGQMTGTQCLAFDKLLDDAQTALNAANKAGTITADQYDAATKAILAYGFIGDGNGVTVNVGDAGGFPGMTSASDGAKKTDDNPTGQNIQVTIDAGLFGGGNSNSLTATIAHEGSHVGDAEDWAKAGFTDAANPTHFDTENQAYGVTTTMMQMYGATRLSGSHDGQTFHDFWMKNATDTYNNLIGRPAMIKMFYPNWAQKAFQRNVNGGGQ